MKGGNRMKTKLKTLIPALLVWILWICLPAQAGEIVPVRDYRVPKAGELPEILYAGVPMDCGPYQIRVMGQPVVTKSNNGMIASHDMNFLIIRIGLTNISDKTVGWLTPDSFLVRETFMGRIYGTYTFNTIVSAKAAAGFNLSAFFKPVNPGETMQTAIVFKVFPGAEGWILSFSPKTFGEENPSCSVEFQLPPAVIQNWYAMAGGEAEE